MIFKYFIYLLITYPTARKLFHIPSKMVSMAIQNIKADFLILLFASNFGLGSSALLSLENDTLLITIDWAIFIGRMFKILENDMKNINNIPETDENETCSMWNKLSAYPILFSSLQFSFLLCRCTGRKFYGKNTINSKLEISPNYIYVFFFFAENTIGVSIQDTGKIGQDFFDGMHEWNNFLNDYKNWTKKMISFHSIFIFRGLLNVGKRLISPWLYSHYIYLMYLKITKKIKHLKRFQYFPTKVITNFS